MSTAIKNMSHSPKTTTKEAIHEKNTLQMRKRTFEHLNFPTIPKDDPVLYQCQNNYKKPCRNLSLDAGNRNLSEFSKKTTPKSPMMPSDHNEPSTCLPEEKNEKIKVPKIPSIVGNDYSDSDMSDSDYEIYTLSEVSAYIPKKENEYSDISDSDISDSYGINVQDYETHTLSEISSCLPKEENEHIEEHPLTLYNSNDISNDHTIDVGKQKKCPRQTKFSRKLIAMRKSLVDETYEVIFKSAKNRESFNTEIYNTNVERKLVLSYMHAYFLHHFSESKEDFSNANFIDKFKAENKNAKNIQTLLCGLKANLTNKMN